MTAHIAHGDVYVEGLDDACPRCWEIARDAEFEVDGRLALRLLDGVLMSATDYVARDRLVAARDEGRFQGWTISE